MSANVSPVAWYGGKSRLASWLAGLLPRHDGYIEVFGGGAAVLFAKPRATLEVYNDIDQGLVTFFRLLRDRPVELQQALRLTPYARSEFEHCRDTWELVEDELERARRWYTRTQMAFACSASSGWGFEVDGAHSGGTRASGYATAVDNLHRFA
jgi:DNA adenine methylase